MTNPLAHGSLAALAAVSARDSDAFGQAFATLTASCNACHLAGDVPFVQVDVPLQRVSSVRLTPPSSGQHD